MKVPFDRVLHVLAQKYKLPLKYTSSTKTFNPNTFHSNIDISGLYQKDSYINKAFLRLTHITTTIMSLESNVTIKIHFYHIANMDPFIVKCIKRVGAMIRTFGIAGHMQLYNNLEMQLLLYDAPRIMPKTFVISPDEMNTVVSQKTWFNCVNGYTTTKGIHTYICVTRTNDALGLIVHEIGHRCRFDLGRIENGAHTWPTDKTWANHVKAHWNIADNCNIGPIYEGYTNANATIVHAMFIALETESQPDSIERQYVNAYRLEYAHAVMFVAKLLRWFRYNSLDDLLRISDLPKYTQSAYMLEYALFRIVYMKNYTTMDALLLGSDIDKSIDVNSFIKNIETIKDPIKTALTHLTQQDDKQTMCNMNYYYHQ
jgi:hypothetical protein